VENGFSPAKKEKAYQSISIIIIKDLKGKKRLVERN